MNLKEGLYHLFCLPKCISCNIPLKRGENVLCLDCMKRFEGEKVRDCSFCFETISRCTCTPKVFKKARIKKLYKLSRYQMGTDDSPTKKLIYSLKHENLSRVFSFIAGALADRLKEDFSQKTSELVIIPIPRRRKNVVRYGYDHAAVLARYIAKILGCKHLLLLKSLAKKEQKGLTAEQRKENAKFKLKKKISLGGKTVILLDDVVTSGSSMVCAAKLLRELSPKKIVGACFSISYRDLDLNANLPF